MTRQASPSAARRGGPFARRAAAVLAAAAALGAASPAAAPAAAGFRVIATIPVSSPPGAPAVDPLNGRVYIPTGDALTVVDAASNTVTGTIPLGAGNGGAVALDPGTGLAFVAGSSVISEVSLATGKVTATLRPGGSLSQIAVDPFTHAVFTTDSEGQDSGGPSVVLKINETTGSVTATAPLENFDGFLEGLASDPATGSVYVTACSSPDCLPGTLFAISEADLHVIADVAVSSDSFAAGVDPGLHDVYVASQSGLQVIDEATDTVTDTTVLLGMTIGAAADPAARIVYALSGNTVQVIDEATDQVIATVPVGDQENVLVADPAVDPVTHEVYAANYAGDSVSVIGGAAPQAGCAASPGACGYPDAQTAGVPAGAGTLKAVPGQVSSGPGWHFDPRGFVQVTGNGADLSGLLIPYNVNITAADVTLSDDMITNGFIPGTGRPAVPRPAPIIAAVTLRHASDVTIEDTTIDGQAPGTAALAAGIEDLYGDSTGLRVLGDDIGGTSVAVQVDAGLIYGNYIHSPQLPPVGPGSAGIKSTGSAGPLIIEHNTILAGGRECAIGLFPVSGPQDSRLVDGNLLAGGSSYTIYGGQAGAQPGSNITVTGNRFSRIFYPAGGRYGPAAHYDPAAPRNAWYGNFWDDTLTPVPA